MPVIEFIGPSGIGKSSLMRTILRGAPTRDWLTHAEAVGSRRLAPQFGSADIFLLDRKLRTVLATRGISVVEIYGILPFFFNMLALDSALRPEFGSRRIVDDDPLFCNFGRAIVDLAARDRAAFARLAANRAFVFLRSAPERIVHSIRQRQARAEYRIATAGASDADLLDKVLEQAETIRQIRDLVSTVGSQYTEIEFDHTAAGYERPVLEFIERVFGAAVASYP